MNGSAPPSDKERYIEAVDERFRVLRGSPLILSGRDAALVFRWHDEGVPLFLVLDTIEDLFRKGAERKPPRLPRTLSYCESAVHEAFAQYRERRLGADGARSTRDAEREATIARVLAALAQSRAPGPVVAAALAELRTVVDGARADGFEVLARVDAGLVDACLAALPPDARDECVTAAARDVAPFAEGLEEAVRARAWRAALARRVRARFAVPDVTLLPL